MNTKYQMSLLLTVAVACATGAGAQGPIPLEEAPPSGIMISPGSAAAREPQVDHEAEKAKAIARLDELEKKYLSLESYHLVTRKVSTVQRTRVEEASSIWMERDEERGPRWRMEMEIVRQIENRAPITTKTINVSGHEDGWTYTRTGDQQRAVRSLPNQWNSHFDVLRRNLSASINLVALEDDEEVMGRSCTVFRVSRGPDMRRTIQRYYVCNESGLLLKETQEREGRLDESTDLVEKIEVNGTIADSIWEYNAPEDVEVMDLREQQHPTARTAPRREMPTLPGM